MSIEIQWQNISTVMTDAQCAAIIAAVQAQVAEDVAPVWGTQAVHLVEMAKGTAMDPRFWQFVIADTSDQAGAAGYHELSAGGEPIGYAFVKSTMDAGMQPSVTISHEILEMVGDALIDQSNQWADLPNAVFLAQELCDPVEDDSLGYSKNGVLVSDFVTPAYFVQGAKAPYDFKDHLQQPNTLAAGGYQSLWMPQKGWQQQFARGMAEGRALIATPHARRVRRAIAHVNRRRSAQ